MDFDDLDEAIEERIAEGGAEELAAIMGANKASLQKFEPECGMPLCCHNTHFPLPDWVEGILRGEDHEIALRAFLFYGPGDDADSLMGVVAGAPPWVEIVVYEWPGHGSRSGEPPASDLEALADDAIQGMTPAMKEMGDGGGWMEGAPFVLIGHSVGAQLLVRVAKKVLVHFGLTPSAVVVIDRAPPQLPLLSEQGKQLLEAEPEALLQSLNSEKFPFMDRAMWASDLKYSCETRDVDYHKLDCDVLVVMASQNAQIEELAKAGSSYSMVTLRIDGSDEQLAIPVEAGTKVQAVKGLIEGIFGNKNLTLSGPDGVPLGSLAAIGSEVIVKGLEAFKHARHPWPHPVAILGAGYNGIKAGMDYMIAKNEDFVIFDRRDQVGGDAWLNAATKHSKLQTDFGMFNIWWGHQYVATGDGGFGRAEFTEPFEGSGAAGVDYHFKRNRLLAHIKHAAEEYGVLAHCRLGRDVTSLEIVGGKDKPERHYKLTSVAAPGGGSPEPFLCSVIYHFPGAYSLNRLVDYPGEDVFDGQIGYGMGDSFVYDDERMVGAKVAILGNGAFAIENVRSCCEHGAKKVYLVTRRKNLASPRLPCWFAHQGPAPTPAYLMLRMFEPMYELCGMGDPWKYHSVFANAERTNVTISQSSRFGIGDVTFLCHAYGLLEYRVDTLKHLTHHTLHLEGGEKLEGVTGLIKSLGLTGDPRVDKLHHMTYRQGNMIEGDFRRVITLDPTGMHAANFSTFSIGIASYQVTRQWHYLHDHPEEVYQAIAHGLLQAVPKHTASKTQPDQPVYVTEVRYELMASMTFASFFPQVARASGDDGAYKYCLIHSLHPADKFLEYCKADWDKYQALFRELGCDHEYIPYPYTRAMIDGYVAEYNSRLGAQIGMEIRTGGPDEAFKQDVVSKQMANQEQVDQELIHGLVRSSKLHARCKGDPYKLAQAKRKQAERERLTFSSPGSGLDFDLEQYGQWSEWTSASCTVADVDADSGSILRHPATWELISGRLEKVKAPIKRKVQDGGSFA